jgi:hypothetical protein
VVGMVVLSVAVVAGRGEEKLFIDGGFDSFILFLIFISYIVFCFGIQKGECFFSSIFVIEERRRASLCRFLNLIMFK